MRLITDWNSLLKSRLRPVTDEWWCGVFKVLQEPESEWIWMYLKWIGQLTLPRRVPTQCWLEYNGWVGCQLTSLQVLLNPVKQQNHTLFPISLCVRSLHCWFEPLTTVDLHKPILVTLHSLCFTSGATKPTGQWTEAQNKRLLYAQFGDSANTSDEIDEFLESPMNWSWDLIECYYSLSFPASLWVC